MRYYSKKIFANFFIVLLIPSIIAVIHCFISAFCTSSGLIGLLQIFNGGITGNLLGMLLGDPLYTKGLSITAAYIILVKYFIVTFYSNTINEDKKTYILSIILGVLWGIVGFVYFWMLISVM